MALFKALGQFLLQLRPRRREPLVALDPPASAANTANTVEDGVTVFR